MKILNYFNHLFIEERVKDISEALVTINSPLATSIILYLSYITWNGYKYRPEEFKIARQFLKEYKFDIYSDDFDIPKLIELINSKY